MDDFSDWMHKLSRELDTLDEGSMKYQVKQNNQKDHRVENLKADCQKTI